MSHDLGPQQPAWNLGANPPPTLSDPKTGMAFTPNPPEHTPWAIETRGLTKRFDRQMAVSDLDLKIAPGEVYGLIGPNGAGKTTLIRMLAIAEQPSIGEIYLHGEPLDDARDNAKLKRLIGYLPDDFPVYDDLKVWDYLDYFARLYGLQGRSRRDRIHEVLELVELGHKRKSLISTLSRGMKQRLGLARTIIHNPLILLLDEPVSGLDPIARNQFRSIIKTLQAAGMTILISSHILSDLEELCSAIGIMELGYLVASTSLAELHQNLGEKIIHIGLQQDTDLNLNLADYFQQCPHISAWETLGHRQRFQVQFSGTEAESVDLLRSLVTAGFPITEFQCQQETLEHIFLKLNHTQSS